MAVVHNAKCPAGHQQDEENTYIDKRGYPHCRECKRAAQRASRAARKQNVTDALAAEFGITTDPNATPQHRAWIGRRIREKAGLPLRRCDRESVTEQMEDL